MPKTPPLRQRHLIPGDDGLLKLERFEEFVQAREELIRQRLHSLFSGQWAEPDDASCSDDGDLALPPSLAADWRLTSAGV